MEKEKQTKEKQTKTKKKRKISYVNVSAIVVSVIVIIGLIGFIFGLVIMADMLKTKPEIKTDDFISEQSSQIFDRNGELVAEVGYVRRENVTYNDLPNVVIDAFIATEDSRFFTHPGFDISRFAKAILENIKSMSFGQGGSTFTMQLVKNTYFVNDALGIGAKSSVERKVQEIASSLELEHYISKKTILELYLNKINFGGEGNIRGIEKACEFYFGKSIKDANLNEAAFLAGVINAPNGNNPYNSIENANERKNTVLYLMNRHGYISDDEYKLAVKVKVEDLLNDEPIEGESLEEFQYQAYVDTVISEVIKKSGYDPSTTPMKIYTAMDPEIQKLCDQIQNDDVDGYYYINDDRMEIASAIVNNHTGEMPAIIGGRNYSKGGALMLNHATDQHNQPGSCIKPMLDYSLAFEHLGWSTAHVLVDKPITIDGTVNVNNVDRRFRGQLTLMDAVGYSLNTPAAQALMQVGEKIGREGIVNHLQKLGLNATMDNFSYQFSYGGAEFRASALELASAQSMLFNGGVRVEPHAVTRIEFMNGRNPIEFEFEKTECISAQAAFLTTELLKNNVNNNFWAFGPLRTSYQTYAKTGTSDWGDSGVQYGIPVGAAKDNWLIGSTSEYTVATWFGYEKAEKGKKSYVTSEEMQRFIPSKITRLILDKTTDVFGIPNTVSMPSGITSEQHILATWPYASVIPNMPEEYIAKGYAKSDSIKLVDPETASIEQMNGELNVTVDDRNTITITWPKYPDESKLEVAKDLDLGNNRKGKLLFDYSWLFGPVQYKADIKVDGITIKTVAGNSNTQTVDLFTIFGKDVEVCGFYGHEKSEFASGTSNVSCKKVNLKDKDINLTVPNSEANYEEVIAWAKDNGLTFDEMILPPDEKHPIDTISIFKSEGLEGESVDVTGQNITIKKSQLKDIIFTIVKYKENE